METIKSTLSLLIAVSLMGFVMIAQHDFQKGIAQKAAVTSMSTAAVTPIGHEAIALK